MLSLWGTEQELCTTLESLLAPLTLPLSLPYCYFFLSVHCHFRCPLPFPFAVPMNAIWLSVRQLVGYNSPSLALSIFLSLSCYFFGGNMRMASVKRADYFRAN